MDDFIISIEELSGSRRTLELVDADLPFPPLNDGGEMSVSVRYYPGRPTPTISILGPRKDPITFSGSLRDAGFSEAGHAWDQKTWIEALRDSGRKCRFTCGDLVTTVIIKSAKFRVRTPHDIGYDLELIDAGGATREGSVVVQPSSEAAPSASILEDSVIDIGETFDETPEVVTDAYENTIRNHINAIDDAIDSVLDPINAAVGKASDFVQYMRRALGAILSAKERLGDMLYSLENELYLTFSTFTRASHLISAASWQKTLRLQTRTSFSEATRLEESVEATYRNFPARFHRVKIEDTLQSLALYYYGDVGAWTKIYEANRELIRSFDADAVEILVGQLLEIPRG